MSSKQKEDNSKRMLRGDVVWVPYRKGPMWPALVVNVYPKKISYLFFPLAPGDLHKEKSNFTCASKLIYALVPSEPLTEGASEELKKAFAEARQFCIDMDLPGNGQPHRGSQIPSYGEAGVEEKRKRQAEKSKATRKAKTKERKREKEDEKEESEPAIKKATSSSEPKEPESSEMMKVINVHLEELIDGIWESEAVKECLRNVMRTKLTIRLRNNQFLDESDYSSLFERTVDLVRKKNASISLISAFKLTANVIMPHVLISCYSNSKDVELEEVEEKFYQQNTRVVGLDPSMEIPVTENLEQLCRLACDESDALQR